MDVGQGAEGVLVYRVQMKGKSLWVTVESLPRLIHHQNEHSLNIRYEKKRKNSPPHFKPACP
jgi:hypothetical protein